MCDVEEEYLKEQKSIAEIEISVPKADFYEKWRISQGGMENQGWKSEVGSWASRVGMN
jgi:hypothetical protein